MQKEEEVFNISLTVIWTSGGFCDFFFFFNGWKLQWCQFSSNEFFPPFFAGFPVLFLCWWVVFGCQVLLSGQQKETNRSNQPPTWASPELQSLFSCLFRCLDGLLCLISQPLSSALLKRRTHHTSTSVLNCGSRVRRVVFGVSLKCGVMIWRLASNLIQSTGFD